LIRIHRGNAATPLALGVVALAALAALGGCASSAPEVRTAPVVLAERCATGPFCVTGEVDDQFATAVEGVRCIALGGTGPVASPEVTSDKRGVFFLDGLAALPPQIRFEKPGFVSQTVAVVPAAPGVTARVYVILHHISQNECTCEPAALISGREPCPPETCGESRFDTTIPETPPVSATPQK
jgi:hypothetical protein